TAPQHYIVRTTWLIGDGPNFVRTMLEAAAKGTAPTVVDDQIGRLTFTSELVRAIDHLLTTQAPFGTYNATNAGDSASWADIAYEIFKLGGFDIAVQRTSSADYAAGKPGTVLRPLKSTMDLSKLERTGFVPRNWHEDLRAYVAKEQGK